jgi:hypothetical protein
VHYWEMSLHNSAILRLSCPLVSFHTQPRERVVVSLSQLKRYVGSVS